MYGIIAWLAYTFVHSWIIDLPPSPRPPPTKEEAERIKAERRADEVRHEAEFWKDHPITPIIAQITTPDGRTHTGKIQFVIDCPADNWCAQPDGRVTDHDGDEPLVDEANAMADYLDSAYRD